MRAAQPCHGQALGHGIHAVDTGFHRPVFDAAHLLVHGGRTAFIDTGKRGRLTDAPDRRQIPMSLSFSASWLRTAAIRGCETSK